MRKLTYFVAVSIYGFIGDETGDGTMFMPFVDEEFLAYLTSEYPDTISVEGRKALGLEGVPNKNFDTVLQGRRSYQVGLDLGITSPYGHLREYVATRTLAESPDPNVELIHDDVIGKVRELKAEEGESGIWLCGGAQLAGLLADEIDELVLKTYPVVFGGGMPMFAGRSYALDRFDLAEHRVFGNGVTVRRFTRTR
ncbi:dihydrofolate reductase family protein [Streptomyces sp. VRA16 Mangrove soil]|uniref:dihydrofolate reductase family protein n=1 Tax=Streptomyces sp. VRA16 Mangrove soil TaxID=2817434 RepID=UPI001A9F4B21|nr:dihydrofolate reductase family protein [Streptomyces sp. VRA16 Mangrove soil]MBO1336128.1 dihydrofolate reductase family protein [Streptomyces sp. VRA16 Mangrove soil]